MNMSHLILGDLLLNNYENKVFNAYDSLRTLEDTPLYYCFKGAFDYVDKISTQKKVLVTFTQ